LSDKPKIKIKWLEKLKNVKHIEIIVVAIFIIVLVLIYTSNFSVKKSSNSQTKTNSKELTIVNYIDNLETDLEQTISQIKGVDNVKVMITLDYSKATIQDNIIQTDSFPCVKGIVIVAKGVENTNVKLNVLKAVEAVVDVNYGCIEILSSN